MAAVLRVGGGNEHVLREVFNEDEDGGSRRKSDKEGGRADREMQVIIPPLLATTPKSTTGKALDVNADSNVEDAIFCNNHHHCHLK